MKLSSLVEELHAPVLRMAIPRAAQLPSPPSALVLPFSALSSPPKHSLLGSRLAALRSQSQRFPLTQSPAFAYKGLARLESEMASPAENPKVFSGEASRHTCKASPVHYNLVRPKFLVPTGHHPGERSAQVAHYLRSCLRTNILLYRQPADRNRLQAPVAYPGEVQRPSHEAGAVGRAGILQSEVFSRHSRPGS